ncbi:glycosyltransferase family 4 protein [Granulicella sibirica]|uniref:Glycosyltransferase n=1 Tax=Granulicella sibirica TaxID=2479048 RepID=A0A4Q0T4A2_9BACT|nr:glycosyltransferase family 4 protein [Granulicella sibirica]RXH56819.1 Glycosyltransferase [Granulicella sibirica]
MRIVQTVFGVFHHFELARQLHQRGHLERIYSTWPWARLKREGLPRELVSTYPWVHTPEMLLQRYGVKNPWLLDQISYANALSFDAYTSRRLARKPAPDALIAISGSSLKTGAELQSRGARLICDRGSSHQRYQEQIVSDEYRRWGVDRPVTDIRDILREEKIYAIADAITVPSTFAARSFIESGVDPAKLHVIPYGVRLEQFIKSGEPPRDRFEVLFAGSVGLRKGIPYLLEAFAQLSRGAKRLRIAGSLHPDLESVLPRLPQQHVEFLGPVDQATLATLMSTSHVLALPSIEDGFGLVIGQALACGCPVIVSEHTGGPDMITEGVEGFIIPIRDASTLRDRMQQICDESHLQSRMRAAGLARMQHLGGWDDYGGRWESLLHTLTGR